MFYVGQSQIICNSHSIYVHFAVLCEELKNALNLQLNRIHIDFLRHSIYSHFAFYSFFSVLFLFSFTFTVKESCLILLQTIPASIDIEVFKADLLKTFDDIVSVHDLHIWQMTSSKYVSTVHILFHNPMVSENRRHVLDSAQ